MCSNHVKRKFQNQPCTKLLNMNMIYKKFLDQVPEDATNIEELAELFIGKEYEEHVQKYSKQLSDFDHGEPG